MGSWRSVNREVKRGLHKSTELLARDRENLAAGQTELLRRRKAHCPMTPGKRRSQRAACLGPGYPCFQAQRPQHNVQGGSVSTIDGGGFVGSRLFKIVDEDDEIASLVQILPPLSPMSSSLSGIFLFCLTISRRLAADRIGLRWPS